jgi:hypothetical protein
MRATELSVFLSSVVMSEEGRYRILSLIFEGEK